MAGFDASRYELSGVHCSRLGRTAASRREEPSFKHEKENLVTLHRDGPEAG